MKTKQLIVSIIFVFGFLVSVGQIKFETQIGGANFLGLTFNTAFDIPLSQNSNHLLTPFIGLGILAPGWDDPTCIIHTGLNYSYKRLGFGAEFSGFTDNPFIADENHYTFVDMIIYPNLNYTIIKKQHWYFKLSAGAYFAFSKIYNLEIHKTQMDFEGDVIPGAGVIIGYKF